MGPRPEPVAAKHFASLGIRYDADAAAEIADASVVLQAVRATAAWRLHQEGVDPETVVSELARWALLPRARAEKSVEFLLHPTWRAYITCYVEGYELCRGFVDDDPTRFSRLLNEQLVPADLVQRRSPRVRRQYDRLYVRTKPQPPSPILLLHPGVQREILGEGAIGAGRHVVPRPGGLGRTRGEGRRAGRRSLKRSASRSGTSGSSACG